MSDSSAGENTSHPTDRFRRHSRGILVVGFAGSFFSVGFSVYLFGVFQAEMLETFGGSVTKFALAPVVMSIVSGLLSPFVGRSLATRGRSGLSIRSVMMAGALAVGLGLLLVSRMPSLMLAGLFLALLVAPGMVMLGPLVNQAMVINWFDLTRGRALGIVAAGTTVAGGVVPVMAALLIEALGWRNAMASLGLMMLAIPLPLSAVFARTQPEDVGEHVDGQTQEVAESAPAPAPPLSTRQLLERPSLWILGLVFGLQFSAGTLSVVFTIPYAQQLGLGLVAGASVLSLRSWCGALGKILLGWLSDHVGPRPVVIGVLIVQAGLTALMIQTRDPVYFSILGLGVGFAGAAMLPLKGALVGKLYGQSSFASAFGLTQLVELPLQLIALPLAGFVYDVTSDWATVFGLTIPMFLVASILLWFVRPSDRPPGGA
ncbi:MFS transporter [Myxococcota bacterium]|nr:MFS transporter [Myxococcota bacterium]